MHLVHWCVMKSVYYTVQQLASVVCTNLVQPVIVHFVLAEKILWKYFAFVDIPKVFSPISIICFETINLLYISGSITWWGEKLNSLSIWEGVDDDICAGGLFIHGQSTGEAGRGVDKDPSLRSNAGSSRGKCIFTQPSALQLSWALEHGRHCNWQPFIS